MYRMEGSDNEETFKSIGSGIDTYTGTGDMWENRCKGRWIK